MIYQNFVFTLNNPEKPYPELETTIKYITYQLERGENGTEHLQGYVQFKKKRAFNEVKQWLPRAHIEPRKGSHEQAVEYCHKTETRIEGPWEFGIPTKKRGQRADLEEVREKIEEGSTELEVAREHFGLWCQYHKAFKRYRDLLYKKRNTESEVILLIGITGTGKSRGANEKYPNAYWKMANKWWDHYDGETEVILDDFNGEIDLQYILRMTDRYPMIIETKGSTQQLQATKFIFTSNKEPKEWWKEVDLSPFYRRITRFFVCFYDFWAIKKTI